MTRTYALKVYLVWYECMLLFDLVLEL